VESRIYDAAKAALQNCIEPSRQRELYIVEYQERKRKTGETGGSWQTICEFWWTKHSDQAKDRLAFDRLVDNPKVAFAVRQQHPDDAVAHTL